VGPCGRRKDLTGHGDPGIPIHRHRRFDRSAHPTRWLLLRHGTRGPSPHHPQQPWVV